MRAIVAYATLCIAAPASAAFCEPTAREVPSAPAGEMRQKACAAYDLHGVEDGLATDEVIAGLAPAREFLR